MMYSFRILTIGCIVKVDSDLFKNIIDPHSRDNSGGLSESGAAVLLELHLLEV